MLSLMFSMSWWNTLSLYVGGFISVGTTSRIRDLPSPQSSHIPLGVRGVCVRGSGLGMLHKSVAEGKFTLSALAEWYYVRYITRTSIATQNPYKEETIILPVSAVP